MKVYLKSQGSSDEETFENFKKYAVNINDTTLKRRLTNLKKWAKFCEELEPINTIMSFKKINAFEIEEVKGITTIQKDEKLSDDARKSHQELVLMMEQFLLEKHKNCNVGEVHPIDLAYEDEKI